MHAKNSMQHPCEIGSIPYQGSHLFVKWLVSGFGEREREFTTCMSKKSIKIGCIGLGEKGCTSCAANVDDDDLTLTQMMHSQKVSVEAQELLRLVCVLM